MTNLRSHQTSRHGAHQGLQFGPTATRAGLLVVFAVLLLLYLAQSTQSATRQYEIRNLESEQATLEEERERLELESLRLQSLNRPEPPKEEDETKDATHDEEKPTESEEGVPDAPRLEAPGALNVIPSPAPLVRLP